MKVIESIRELANGKIMALYTDGDNCSVRVSCNEIFTGNLVKALEFMRDYDKKIEQDTFGHLVMA